MATLFGINLLPIPGSLIYAPTSTSWGTLSIGTTGQILISNGTVPTYVTPSGGISSISSTGVVTLSNQQAVISISLSTTLQTNQCGAILTNSGSSGAITLTLPSPSAALNYTFVVVNAFLMTISVANSSTDTIMSNSGSTTTTGHNLSFNGATSQYAEIRVVAINSTQWIISSSIGNWSLT